MKEFSSHITYGVGLHARPASLIVNEAKKFECEITLYCGQKKANAKSMVSILKLGAKKGADVRVCVEGSDEEAAFEKLEKLFETELSQVHHSDHADFAETDSQTEEKQVELSQQGHNQTGVNQPDNNPTGDSHNLNHSGTVLKGIKASPGIVSGPAFQWKQPQFEWKNSGSKGFENEHKRLKKAVNQAKKELSALKNQVTDHFGSDEAAIFDAHLDMMEDPEIHDMALSELKSGKNAVEAWHASIEYRKKQISDSDDSYLAAREIDIQDIGNRVLKILNGGAVQQEMEEPVILIADNLTPSDTAGFDSKMLLGICTVKGSPSSHTAILARALGIPAMVGISDEVLSIPEGKTLVLNSDEQQLLIDPDEEMLNSVRVIENKKVDFRNKLLESAAGKAVTLDGKSIKITANIASSDDAEKAVQSGADGIGLLRTEFLFQNETQPPTEDEQFQAYSRIIHSQKGRPVIIRTLDAGSDKPVKFIKMDREENPALGQRGVRLSLEFKDIFLTQIRAIVRSSKNGPVGMMIPMITSTGEWFEVKSMIDQVCREFKDCSVETGIMIEVPAAAINSKAFAGEVDFFSIGTNDLVQYTLAVDRMNHKMAPHFTELHPAVIHLIQNVVDNAHVSNTKVSVCGEMASDPLIVPLLIGLGVDELSVNVPSIPEVKMIVRSTDFSHAGKMADRISQCTSGNEIKEILTDYSKNLYDQYKLN